MKQRQFTHASLFSGIGGFDLAAEWMGWKNSFHCEWNEFGQKILKYYWPNATSYGDIKQTDFTVHRGTIDVLTGGFPCQPYSLAGKRRGKEDERHLWPQMLRAIREIAPRYVVGENVYGLVNWNGGLVFNEVQLDLEAAGYEVQPVILPACAVNAPHRRDRVWFIAHNTNARVESLQQGTENRVYKSGIASNAYNDGPHGPEDGQGHRERNDGDSPRTSAAEQLARRGGETTGKIIANARCVELKNGLHGQKQGWQAAKFGDSYTKFGRFSKFPKTEPTICGGNDGVSNELDGITVPKWRNESIKAYGNAIVPQVALQIFNAINLHAASYGWR